MKLPQGISCTRTCASSCASCCVKFSTVLHFDARNLHEIFLAHENGASFWCKFLACMSSALIVSSPCYSNLATKKWGCTVSNYQLPLCPTVIVCTTTLCGVFVLDVRPRYSVTVTTTIVSISKYRYRYRYFFGKVSISVSTILLKPVSISNIYDTFEKYR